MTNTNKFKTLADAYSNLLMLVVALIILLGVAIIIHEFSNANSEDKAGQPFCGVKSMYDHGDENLFKKQVAGKKLFKSKCAPCHNKNMRDELTGPALKDCFTNWNGDTINFVAYLNNSEAYLKTKPTARIVKQHEAFGFVKSHENALTVDDVMNILTYIEK